MPSSRWTASSAAITRASGGIGIGRAVRVGDVALHARHVDPHVDRAAAADLDRVAEPVDRGRLADQDHVGPDLALVQPVDDPRRAVSRIAFLVAGDQQRQRAGVSARCARSRRRRRRSRSSCRWRRARPAGRPRSVAANGSPVQPSPGGTTSRWPGEAEMRRAGSADRHHVLGRPVGRLAHHPAMDREAERLERRLEHVEHRAAGGRDARAADQLLRQARRDRSGRPLHDA